MANEKKNGTLEEIIMEMLKEGKAVRIPLKDVVDKMQENVKAAEDAQEAVQPETEKSEAVPQGGQVKTVPINIHIDNLHIHMDERMTSYNNFEGDSDETDEPDEDEPEDIDVDAMIGLIKAKTRLCEKHHCPWLNFTATSPKFKPFSSRGSIPKRISHLPHNLHGIRPINDHFLNQHLKLIVVKTSNPESPFSSSSDISSEPETSGIRSSSACASRLVCSSSSIRILPFSIRSL